MLPGELGRRIELTGRINDGHLEYAQGWPEVTAVTGEIHVAGVDTRIRASSAHSGEVKLSGADIVLHDNARFAAGTIETTGTDAAAALEFIRSSPLAEMMSFITPGWAADGALNLHGNLRIPISVEQAPPLRVDLQFYLDGFDLDMPDYRVAVADLRGSGTYSLPHNLKGRFSGNMFEQPATFAADFDEEWVRFDIAGSATPEDVYELLDSEYEVPVQGQFNFDSELSLAMGDGVTNLAMDTDLAGLQIDLPGVFAKDAADATPSELEVQFLSSYQTVSWRYRDVSGWLHYGDDIERGAVGVGVPPPMTAQDEKAMVVAGHMAELVLGNWISGSGEDAIVLPFDWKIQDLRVDRFMIEEVAFADMILSGAQRGEDMKFDFAGPELTGKVDIPADGVIDLAIEYVRIEDPDAGYEAHIGAPKEDPLSVEVGASLPAANVSIAQLDVGDEPFGAWRFVLEPQEQRVVFKPFAADVNGVHIADSTVTWDLARNVSSFKGSIKLDDLQETLPKWDYAPSVTTDRASVVADLSWPGSPVNVSVMQTDGEFEFKARDGRFIEVESGSGGLRILGLLNFTKLAQRINFDISDVSAKVSVSIRSTLKLP